MEAINNPEDASAGHAARFRFRGCCTSSRTIFARIRRSSISACRRAAKCGCATRYFVTCTGVVKNERGEVMEIHCTYDPATRGGNAPDGRKVKSTIHWVSAAHAIDAEVRLYETLVHARESERGCRRSGFHRQSESEFARSAERAAKLEPGLRRRRGGQPVSIRAAGLFLRGSRHVRPRSWSSIAPLRCATPGRKSKRNRNEWYLGLGGLLGDAACAVLKDGELCAAIEENEGDARHRCPARMPQASIAECLRLACAIRATSRIASRSRARSRAERRCIVHLRCAISFQTAKIVVVEHHAAHAASAYFASPFERRDRSDARSRRRFSLRRTLARERKPAASFEKEMVLSRFAGPISMAR